MTTETSTPENQELDPQAILHRMEEDAWRQGKPGPEFLFSYLFVEIKFATTDESSWGLSTRSLDIDALEKALQREDEMLQQVLQSESFPWVKYGLPTKLVNASELQPSPFAYADLIFVCLSLPHWVSPAQRPKLLAKLRNILVLYRTNNPDAIIVAVTKHAPFRLKDRLSYQWADLSKELGGIGNKGVITRMVAQQLSSPTVLQSYLQENHTTHKLTNMTRLKDLQAHLESLQYAQTSMRLIVVIHNQLYDTYARRTTSMLRNNKFSKFMVIKETELNATVLRKCDFLILMGVDISAELRKTKEFAQKQKRIYRFDLELPEKLPDVPARYENLRNSLETRYMQLRENLKKERYSDYFQLIFQKYETYQDLAANRFEIEHDMEVIDAKCRKLARGYYNLIEAMLMVGTRRVHALTRFGGIMRQMTRYLIVDEFSDDVIEHLVQKGFPRHQLTFMSSMDFLQVFLRHKVENPQLAKAPTEAAYQHFIQNAAFFKSFEVVFINGWNLEENGDLVIKLRTCMVADEDHQNPKPTFSSENLHEFLSTSHDKIVRMILPEKDGKETEQDREKEATIRDTLSHMMPMTELTPLAKMMARKKNHTFRMKTLEEEERKLLDGMRADDQFAKEKELASTNFGQELSSSITPRQQGPAKLQRTGVASVQEEEEAKATTLSPEEELFGTIIQFRLNVLKTISFACGIRWLAMLQNKKAAFFLEIQPKAQNSPLEELLEFGQICASTDKGELPEDGLRSAIPIGDYPERIVYIKDLPNRREFDGGHYLLYVIDCECYTFDDIMRCLYMKNLSVANPVPVLLVMSPGFLKTCQKGEETLLGHLAGIETRDDALTPKGFPIPHRVETMEDAKQIKYLVRGILNVPMDFYDAFEKKQASEGDGGGTEGGSAARSEEAQQAAIQEELKDFDWSKFPL